MIYLLIYFVVGLIQDFIWTLNIRFIDHDKIFRAALTSFLGTVITTAVIYDILTRLEKEESIVAIVIYAAGVASGTFFWMHF